MRRQHRSALQQTLSRLTLVLFVLTEAAIPVLAVQTNVHGSYDGGIRLNPNDEKAYYNRGMAYLNKGEWDKAINDYREAIQINPTNDLAYNNLAWLRATCPVEALRNGEEAVKAATRACELTHWARWDWIDTLAAAYAEAGDFKSAVEYQKKAMQMNGISQSDLEDMQRHLSLYEHHQPNHQGQKH